MGPSSFTLVLLASCILAGCQQRHTPWERAAPDGSAILMRIEVSGGRPSTNGFLEVRFDGTYAASPMNELRVCTGTLDPAARDAWTTLIERTGAFDREGAHGNVIDGGITEVRLGSEDGLYTRFTLHGGPGFGNYDAALAGFTDATADFWQTLDAETCAPVALDPTTSSLSAWVHPFDLSGDESRRFVTLEVHADGAVGAFFGYSHAGFEDELAPCAPLADPEPLWATVLAARPFDPAWPDDASREASVSVRTRVTAEDRTLHDRSASGVIQPSRPEQLALQDALLALVEVHCPP